MNDFGISGLTRVVPFTSGGSSVIYEAWQEDFDRRVAVKVLSGSVAERTRRRFERERHAAGRLSGHPGILDIYAGGVTSAGELYLIMPFIEGGSLQGELNRGGRFALKKAIADISAIAEGLEFAHRQGVVHRDIKPANILRDKGGKPLIADFGIAQLLDADVASTTITANTPLYAAPEVLSDAAATVSSDVYSLGAMLYALLAGRPAFSGGENDNIWTIMGRIRIEEPQDIPGVPLQVMDVIRGAMAKTPINRPTSARLFAQYLRFAMHESARNPQSEQVRTKHQIVLSPDQPLHPGDTPFRHPNYTPASAPVYAQPVAEGRTVLATPKWLAPVAVAAAFLMFVSVAAWRVFPVFGNSGAEASEVATSVDSAYTTPIDFMPTAVPEPTSTAIPDPTVTPVPPTEEPAKFILPDPTATPEPTFVGTRFEASVPADWDTRRDNVDVGYGYRSEFRASSGQDFLIIDTTPKNRATPGVTIDQSAQYVAGTIGSASAVTYEQIGDKDAWWFSYTGNDGSRRIDIFFEVDGNGYAVVGGSYGNTDAAFEAARDFVRTLNNKQ